MSKKTLAVFFIGLAAVVMIAAIVFFSMKTTEAKICSGKWDVVLSVVQDGKHITVTDSQGHLDEFELTSVMKFDLGCRTPFLIRQKIMIDGRDYTLKYRHHPQNRGAVYHLTLKPGEKQRFDLLFMPQWKIAFRNLFGWNFISTEQYAGKFNYRRADLAAWVSDKDRGKRSGGRNAKKGNR